MAYVGNGIYGPRTDIRALVLEGFAEADKFIGSKILPVYNSPVKSGTYLRWPTDLGEIFNRDNGKRVAGANYTRLNPALETDTFDCEEYGFESPLPDDIVADLSRFGDIAATTAKMDLLRLMIEHEARASAIVNNASTFTATAALVAYTEANLATINLPGDVAAAKNRLLKKGLSANTIAMSGDVYERVRRSTLVQNQIFGVVPKGAGQFNLPDEAAVAAALGVQNLYVSRAPFNANKKGQSFSGSYIWGNTYVAVLDAQAGEFTAGGVGRTIVWTGDSQLFSTETYREDALRQDVIRVRHSVDEVVINSNACELVTTSFA
jgi:hypothetical protein